MDTRPEGDDPDDQGGDPACWLDQVCEQCGQLIEAPPHECGAPDR